MKTLLTLFSKGRSELQTEIDQTTSLEQAVKLVQDRLDDLKTMYIGDLSVTQARMALFFLDTLRQSIATLTAVNETKSSLVPQQITSQAPQFSQSLILKLLQLLICVGILFSLFSLTRSAPLAWMAILLMSLLIGLEAAIQLDKNYRAIGFLQSAEAPLLNAGVDSKILLDNLADALNTIDRAVVQADEVKKPLGSNSGIEEMPELLDFLQMLIGTSALENPDMTLELTKLIPQILMEQGIRAQIYRPNDEHSGRSYFDFEPPIDQSAEDYVTLTPALLKGDRLLRRGRVIEPAYFGVTK